MRRYYFFLLLLCCVACAEPQVQQRGIEAQSTSLTSNVLQTSDGQQLPLRAWLPKQATPKAVVIALHGMNDYSHAFEMPAALMNEQGIAVYAYDQRGFGGAVGRGIWAGENNLVADLRDMVILLKARYPKTPLFVMGESMGAAVAIAACSKPDFPAVNGVILSAPAVWGGDSMNIFYRASLWTMAHVMPAKILTGEGLHILASDNIPMLRELGRDSLVLKGTRMDSIYGLVQLMGKGYEGMKELRVPALILYGQNDQVIPPEAIEGAIKEVPQQHKLAYYPAGYHLLLRDLHRDIPTYDAIAWMLNQTPLPSGYEQDASHWKAHKKSDLREQSNYLPHEVVTHIYK